MIRTQGYRRPAALTLIAAVLLAGLSIGPAQADPEPGDDGKLVMVLDSSGSMKEPAGDGQTKIVAARTALTRVVNKLPETPRSVSGSTARPCSSAASPAPARTPS